MAETVMLITSGIVMFLSAFVEPSVARQAEVTAIYIMLLVISVRLGRILSKLSE